MKRLIEWVIAIVLVVAVILATMWAITSYNATNKAVSEHYELIYGEEF